MSILAIGRGGSEYQGSHPLIRGNEADNSGFLDRMAGIGNFLLHDGRSKVSIFGSAVVDTVIGTLHDVRRRENDTEGSIDEVLPLIYEDPDQTQE